MRSRSAPWAWLFSIAFTACAAPADDSDDTDVDTDPLDDTDEDDAPPIDLAGSWRSVSGDGAPLGSYGTGTVRYATFEAGTDADSGRVSLYGEDAESGLLSCPTALYAFNGAGGLVVSSRSAYGGSRIVLLTVIDDDTIELTDETGVPQRFERVDEVPAESQCGTVVIDSDVTVDISLSNWANLLWNGTALLVGDNLGAFYEVDPTDGALGDVLQFGSTYENLVTMQGTDGWGHCACGGSEEIVRVAEGGTQVDAVATPALGRDIGVRGGAWDGTNLLVSGYSYDDREYHVLVVNTAAEPDTLAADIVAKAAPNQLAVHGGAVLSYQNGRIFRFDTASGEASATWQIPAAYSDVSWRGIASSGTDLFLLGELESEVRLVQIDLD